MEKLKNQLKNNDFSNIYLFCGEEEYLRDYYSLKISEAICPDEDNKVFNYLKINGVKPDPDIVDEFISNYPFMCDKKILIVKNSGLLKKANEADKKYWKDVFENVDEYAVVIFSESEVDKRGVLYKELVKKADVYEFKYQKVADLTNWVAKVLTSEGKKMLKQDIEYLIYNCDSGMISLKSEIDKLVSYSKDREKITKSDIDILVCKSSESRVFAMIDDLVDGKLNSALEKLEAMKKFKESPVAIISLIARQYTMFRKIKLLLPKMSVKDVAKELDTREFFLEKHINAQKKITKKCIDDILIMCSKLDSEIKSGKIDGWIAVELLFNKCMQRN